jgi:LCP family protein required for cell wall assembly
MPRHAYPQKTSMLRKTLKVTALGVSSILVLGVGLFMYSYAQIQGNITEADPAPLIGTQRPEEKTPDDPNAGEPLNILIMGSDTREGDNSSLGGEADGMRSDTTLLAHISADRSRVEVISIPRDSWVDIPSCDLGNGNFTRERTTKFNAAFAYGGQAGDVTSAAACSIKTIESLTDVYINGFAIIDFSGFASVVDALGGVEMNIPERIESPKADGLILEAGLHNFDGATALQYARARTGVGLGDGSDTQRISRQQELFEAIITKAQSSYTDLPKLYNFLSTASSTVTVSPNLSDLQDIAGLVWSLRSVSDQNITFVTVPTIPRGDGANVLWSDEAEIMWNNIINDIPLTPQGEASTTDIE